MSLSTSAKRMIVLAMMLLIALSVLGLSGCSLESTEEILYELNADGTGYLVTVEGKFIGTQLTICSEYEGLPVLGVEAKAFKKCKNLESVVIEGGNQDSADFVIGSSAFEKCKALKSVTVERTGNVTVDSSAFSKCESLESVDILQAKDVTMGSYSFEYIKQLTISISGADVKMYADSFFTGNKEYSYSLNLTDCTGTLRGSFVNLNLVQCSLDDVSGSATNLVLDNTRLQKEDLFYYAKNAVFRNTVVYRNNYKNSWLSAKGGIIDNLVIESIGEGSEFSQICDGNYYPLANSITVGSEVTEIPSGVFGDTPFSELENGGLTVTYGGASAAFKQLPFDTLHNGNLLRGDYTLNSADGQPATVTFIDSKGNTVATADATVGATLDLTKFALPNEALVPGEIVNGYWTDAAHTAAWDINTVITGDTVLYISLVDRALLQKAEIEVSANGLAFTPKNDTTFTYATAKGRGVALAQLSASLAAKEFATLEFFGNLEGTAPAPELIDELGIHYVYAHVTSWDKSVTNVYTLEITVKDVYEVVFICDGKTYSTRTCMEGQSIGMFPFDPDKRGHTFLGWSTDGTESGIISESFYTPTKSHTLTAVFKQDIYTLRIEGTDLSYQVTWGETLTLPVENRDYYAFEGYEYNGELLTDSGNENRCYLYYSFEQSVTVKARYVPIRYAITLSDTYTTDTTYITAEDEDLILPTPSRDWYTFIGWFTQANGNGEQITEIKASAPSSYYLHAHYELATYTVRFMDGEDVIETHTFDCNTAAIPIPTVPQKDGYASAWEQFTLHAASFDVQVARTPIVYTITYNNLFGSAQPTPLTYTVEDAIVFSVPTREHYDFTGWQDQSGKIITGLPKGSLGDITVTAQWAITKYTVYIFTDDGSSVGHKVEYNTQFNLDTVEIPTATDKLFIGWYNNDYTEQLAGSITVTGDVNIRAKWRDSVCITTVEDFEKIRENPSGAFHLMGDVDMRGELVTPISDFAGILDGRGFKLYNFTLKINATLSSFGLINVNNGTIRNLTLENVVCSVTADGTEACIGILVGRNKGTVSNCHVTSPSFTVSSSRHVGVGFDEGTTVYPLHIGGLVGKNDATVANCSANVTLTARFDPSVSAPGHWAWTHEMRPYIGGLVGTNSGTVCNSSATSTIACTGQGHESGNMTCARNCFYIGGLVGTNTAGFTIEQCYASTEITVSADSNSGLWTEGKIYVGAFIGSNSGIIKESYATGDIDAYAFTAGYVGGFVGNDAASSNISNCYTTATVTCTVATNVGGFIGNLSGTVQNCYATGTVSAESGSNVAGFVGAVASGGIANKCFTTSNVSANSTNAGFFNANTSNGTSIITNCYYAASAAVLQNGTKLERAEENGAKRDYLSNITNQTFLQSSMYFYPEYWIFTTGTPILKWEVQTDGTSLTGGSHYHCATCGNEFVSNTSSQATVYYDKAVSCDTDAIRYFGCTVCNKHFAVITQQATGHSYSNDAAGKDFCNDDVLVTYTCTNSGCNHTYTKQFTATGHRHDHTDSCIGCGYTYVAPTCHANGSLTFICDDCGNETVRTIPAEHLWEFVSWDVAPTCLSDGYASFACTRCTASGASADKKDYVQNSKLGHMDLTGDGVCDRSSCQELICDATDAVQISTAADLLAISMNAGSGSLAKTYILTADIDLKDVAWEPIGTAQSPFTGVFLGGGFKIKNVPLFASDTTLGYCGLFGHNSGLISNLTVQFDSYVRDCNNRNITFGSIAAFNNGTINRCTIEGAITLSFVTKAEVNEAGASAAAAQSVTLGLVAGINNGFIVGCDVAATYSFTFESYAFMGEEIDHVEMGLLTSGNYKNMTVTAAQTVVAGAICGKNTMSITNCTVSGTGTVQNRLSLSQFIDGAWGYLRASSNQSLGTVAGNQNLVDTQNNTHTGTLTYANDAGTYKPAQGNDPGNNYYSMSCETTITVYD